MLNERKKILGKPKPKGFGSDEPSAQLGPINQEAERIIRGMKNQSAKRFRSLYGKRDKEVMTLTANKLALKDQLNVMYYKDFIDLPGFLDSVSCNLAGLFLSFVITDS